MHHRLAAGLILLVVPVVLGLAGRGSSQQQSSSGAPVSFKKDVMPLLNKYCLPCHAEESYNPSQLSLDSHELLTKGGEHGSPVVPGKPDESIFMQKLLPDPPFGDRMPIQSKRRKAAGPPRMLTEEETGVIARWIREGARNN